MRESILDSIKKMLGADAGCRAFDEDILIWINSAIFTLHQLGIDSKTPGFVVTGSSQFWGDYLENIKDLEAVKNFIFYTVKLNFDPPDTAAHLQAMRESKDELAWRLNVEVDPR